MPYFLKRHRGTVVYWATYPRCMDHYRAFIGGTTRPPLNPQIVIGAGMVMKYNLMIELSNAPHGGGIP